jgi:type II secretion system protein J
MRRRAPGFTLVEMMVAIVIFLIFIGGVYGIYFTVHGALTRTEAEEDLLQTGRVVLAELQTALCAAVPDPKGMTSALTGQDTDGDAAGPQTDALTFLTTAHVPAGDAPAGDVVQVKYTVNPGTDGSTPGLYVEETRHPGLEPDDATPAPRLVSSLVTSFNVLYLTSDGWQPAWENQTALPPAVRVELTLRSDGPHPREETLVTTANLARATAATGGTDGT